MQKFKLRYGVLWLIFLVLPSFSANTINSAEIVSNTLKGLPRCLHYHITGLCFWLRCSPLECHVETTLKVAHYLPDVVVSVFTQPNNNPWWFAKTIADPVFHQVGEQEIKHTTHFDLSGGNEQMNSARDLNNKFHEVDVLGNPTVLLLPHDILLTSSATAFKPYYSSLLDAYAWRFPAAEKFYPGSQLPGLHEVGTLLLHDWGPVYPRNGYVNQPDDAKAAAVNALRASMIVTEKNQPHVYQRLSNNCGAHCTVDPVQENNANTQYQLVYPKAENQCVVFGQSDITQLRPWETDASMKGHHRYLWVLWRHYQGCLPDPGAMYLGSIRF